MTRRALIALVALISAGWLVGCGGGHERHATPRPVRTNHGPPPPPPSPADPSDSSTSRAPKLGPPLHPAGFGAWRLSREPALVFDGKVHAIGIYFRLSRDVEPKRYGMVIRLNGSAVEPQAEGRGWELRTRGNCFFAGAGAEGTTGRHTGDLVRVSVSISRLRDHKLVSRSSSAAHLRAPLEQEDEPDNRWLHALGCGDSGYHRP